MAKKTEQSSPNKTVRRKNTKKSDVDTKQTKPKQTTRRQTKKNTPRQTKTTTLEKKTNTATRRRTTSKVSRILCFTNFNHNPSGLLKYIHEIKDQTYTGNIDYLINIFVESREQENTYKDILKNYYINNIIKICFSKNTPSDIDDVTYDLGLLKSISPEQYNTFICCDPSFSYNANHIENLIALYADKPCDVLQITNDKTIKENLDLYKNSNHKYNFIFNNKSLDVILASDQQIYEKWIDIWSEHKIKIRQLGHVSTLFQIYKANTGTVAQKTSDSHDNYYKNIENDHFAICIFEHNYWSSFVYLNKRNNRMYNIDNDDHGAFEIKDDNTINIKWDTWGDEIFYKKYDNENYFYTINPQ